MKLRDIFARASKVPWHVDIRHCLQIKLIANERSANCQTPKHPTQLSVPQCAICVNKCVGPEFVAGRSPKRASVRWPGILYGINAFYSTIRHFLFGKFYPENGVSWMQALHRARFRLLLSGERWGSIVEKCVVARSLQEFVSTIICKTWLITSYHHKWHNFGSQDQK